MNFDFIFKPPVFYRNLREHVREEYDVTGAIKNYFLLVNISEMH